MAERNLDTEVGKIPIPIEEWAGVGLAPWRNSKMSYDVLDRISLFQRQSKRSERGIFSIPKREQIAAFHFYAYGKVVATGTAAPLRCPCVPSAFAAGHKLHYLAVALYKKCVETLSS